jgi:hypothetical protein
MKVHIAPPKVKGKLTVVYLSAAKYGRYRTFILHLISAKCVCDFYCSVTQLKAPRTVLWIVRCTNFIGLDWKYSVFQLMLYYVRIDPRFSKCFDLHGSLGTSKRGACCLYRFSVQAKNQKNPCKDITFHMVEQSHDRSTLLRVAAV